MFKHLPDSVLQCATVFLSIIIEALPFVLLGSIVAGFLESYLTPIWINKHLPQNPFLRVLVGILLGFCFPSCECGIVPIVNRFLQKQVPSSTAIPFLVAAPIINPIVLFATFVAFGNSIKFALLRALGALVIATILGLLLAFVIKEPIFVLEDDAHTHDESKSLWGALSHAVEEFFDSGRYLVFGALMASSLQVYVPTKLLTQVAQQPLLAILSLLVLAFILSLCSEADAFIGASLLSSFGMAPVICFLVFGPIIDIKNLLMMTRHFRLKYIVGFVMITTVITLIYGVLL